MLKPARYYLFGLVIAIISLVAAELIWLPAPIRTESGMQWIEMIDRLFFGLALVPLSWAVGSLIGIWNQRRERSFWMGLLQLVRFIIAAASMIGAYLVLFSPESLFLLLIFIVLPLPLIFIDLLFSEALNNGRIAAAHSGPAFVTKRKRLLRMPMRSGMILILTVVILVVLLFPTGYQVTYPGMTMNLNRYAHVEGGGNGGTVNGVLVFNRPAVPADWLYARLLPLYEFEIIPENEPPLSESYAQVVMMKNDANGVAASLAMQKAGVGDGITAVGVRVVAVVKNSPAEGRIHAGDIIDKLDNHDIRSLSDLTAYMKESVKPGQSVVVTLRRQEAVIIVDVQAGASAETPDRPVFGISVQTELNLDVPRSIDYTRYMAHIGGPSHGAMLTLAFIDQLTPGGVTYGNKVAGTGTIEPDGSVGLIGGIKQKAYAISRTDADVFFVPAVLEEAARSGAPELNIVPVRTIDDVLSWLAQNKK